MEIVPFGKYKGQPVEAMAQDKQYIEWLQSQSWFTERYQNLNTLIINNFGEASETPEHNKIQALFTDNEFCLKFIKSLNYNKIVRFPSACLLHYECFKKDPGSYWPKPVTKEKPHAFCKPEFEFGYALFEDKGVDVKLYYSVFMDDLNYEGNDDEVFLELKPALSDDYPAVLRQMKVNQSTILCIKDFSATGATFEQVQKIFNSGDKHIVIIPSKYF